MKILYARSRLLDFKFSWLISNHFETLTRIAVYQFIMDLDEFSFWLPSHDRYSFDPLKLINESKSQRNKSIISQNLRGEGIL